MACRSWRSTVGRWCDYEDGTDIVHALCMGDYIPVTFTDHLDTGHAQNSYVHVDESHINIGCKKLVTGHAPSDGRLYAPGWGHTRYVNAVINWVHLDGIVVGGISANMGHDSM